ncbi:unnamed protein product [Peronospora destructor]|uniref:Glycosyltransferase 2-like domain-containing protein n=1 Tax=Peronospora destructor TaxID=86335 RepID=A0AAV0VCW0_9STRA|nr:unnamed protein product [Peronospora destructor]
MLSHSSVVANHLMECGSSAVENYNWSAGIETYFSWGFCLLLGNVATGRVVELGIFVIFEPHFPPEKWPTVDIMLCHYAEPAADTIATLEKIMSLRITHHIFSMSGFVTMDIVNPNAGDVRHEVASVCTIVCVNRTSWRWTEMGAKNTRLLKMPTDANPRICRPKLGHINNVLYNEGACGRYAIILDNDMKPHEMFIQATLPFFFWMHHRTPRLHDAVLQGVVTLVRFVVRCVSQPACRKPRIMYCSKDCYNASGYVTSSIHRRQTQNTLSELSRRGSNPFVGVSADDYSDHVSVNQVGYVQTPQYFEDCLQLRLGDPCGHRNSTFFDSAQTGMDGYDCASFAGTNAIFRREALDSVCGIQYGSLTEDAYTGKMMVDKGWKGYYFRKDLEGEEADRIRLAEGAVPESKSLVDPEWTPPQVELPPKRKINKFMRWVFFMNLTVYPIGSFPAIFFFYITGYFLYTGQAPIYTSGLRLLMALVPKIVAQSILSALSNRTVDNDDVLRSQQTWFSYAFVHVIAVFETFYWKITGKEATWANTGAIGGNSIMELPNLLVFMSMVFGMMWDSVRYFAGYNNAATIHGTPLYFASLFLGGFLASQLGPMVRMSVQTYFGWSHKSMTDQGNIVGSFSLAFVLIILCIWVYVETPNHSIFG